MADYSFKFLGVKIELAHFGLEANPSPVNYALKEEGLTVEIKVCAHLVWVGARRARSQHPSAMETSK